ncbi:MAG TPA: hypothetical protein VN677_12820 [Gemmatimonadaceae bacterium]|jgi:hypothetical protein|nr:hypothetical protein [Gemmatimonadaceae bacterium]
MQIRSFSALGVLPLAAVSALGASSSSSTAPLPMILGSTPAWRDGVAVTTDYTANFECRNPPSANSASQCEIGADPNGTHITGGIPTNLSLRFKVR